MRARRLTQAPAQSGLGDQPLERLRKAGRVARFEQQAGALLSISSGNAPERAATTGRP